MVANIVTGKSIKGAVNYNEHKVANGKAVLMDAVGYLKSTEQLSFSEKLERLSDLASLHEEAQVNCVHININFAKEDTLDRTQMRTVAEEYLNRIGFKGQPYLLYEHLDAAHKHMHLVTTNIRSDRTRIPLHNLGRTKSMKACRELEKQYGLVNAANKKQEELSGIKPIAEKVVYGKSETKASVSNIVRAVIRDYKFASLAEMNAVLRGFNVEAYRGEKGTAMFEKGGLTYHVLNSKGKHIGVPIKSSSIYPKPTLKNLEKVFEESKVKRTFHKQDLASVIDKVLRSPVKDRFTFRFLLKKAGVDVLYRENESMVYGITFVDHNTKCVFNGSELGKDYTAKRLLERITESGSQETERQEKDFEQLQSYISDFDYTKSVQQSVEQLYSLGYRLDISQNKYGQDKYLLSFQEGNSSLRATGLSKFDHYFEQGGVTESLVQHINEHIIQNSALQIQLYIQNLFAERSATYFGHTTADEKRKKRKVNW